MVLTQQTMTCQEMRLLVGRFWLGPFGGEETSFSSDTTTGGLAITSFEQSERRLKSVVELKELCTTVMICHGEGVKDNIDNFKERYSACNLFPRAFRNCW
jgi:hypothetical protein